MIQFRQDFLGEHFFELNEMESVAHFWNALRMVLHSVTTETGRKVARYLAELPSCRRQSD